METGHIHLLQQFFKTLSDPTRLRLIALLAEQSYPLRDLADLLGIRDATTQHHLQQFIALDLVYRDEATPMPHYHLNLDTLHRLQTELLPQDEPAPQPDDADHKILKNYLDGDRITIIPSKNKKKIVVLRWLANRFAVDTNYTEPEVNAIIQQHHADSATLRRDLVMYQFLHREQGIYRRLPPETTGAHIQSLLG